jgi:hypothetical protein
MAVELVGARGCLGDQLRSVVVGRYEETQAVIEQASSSGHLDGFARALSAMDIR